MLQHADNYPDDAAIAEMHRKMAEALTVAIDREVQTLRDQNLPIYVADEDGNVIDLQQTDE